VSLSLAAVAAGLSGDVHAALVLDGAGRHGARGPVVPANVTPVPLPPYSPESSPVERVRPYLRERFPSVRVLADCRAVVDACCAARNRLVAEPGRLRSLRDQPWIRRVSSYPGRAGWRKDGPGGGRRPSSRHSGVTMGSPADGFCATQDLQTVLRCHVAAFAATGGAPSELLYDRMSCPPASADPPGMRPG
jgi:hypothetical protein